MSLHRAGVIMTLSEIPFVLYLRQKKPIVFWLVVWS